MNDRSPKKPFLAGSISGITSMSQLVKLLQPYFLSSSVGQAPGSSLANSGNRVVALTTDNSVVSQVNGQSGSVVIPPIEVTSLALTAGSLTWAFSPGFNVKPIVTATPIAAPPSAGTNVYVFSAAANSVIVKSTDVTDTRTVNLIAVGNPD